MFFLIAAIFSIVYTCIRLNKPGVSREVRQLILRRHVVYVIIYLLVNVYYVIGDLLDFFTES